MLEVIREAGDMVGGVPALAAKIGLTRQSLYQWKKVPSGRVLPIEQATGGKITRHQLRPDLYPEGGRAA